jgi:hypothetical protein
MRGKHARSSKFRRVAGPVAFVGGALALGASFPASASASTTPAGDPGAPHVQHLRLTARDAQLVPRDRRTSPGKYTIRQGDTLGEIAQRFW